MKHLPLNNTDFENLYKDFSQMIKVKGYSRGKNTMYPACAREFLFFIENRGIDDIKEVKPQDVIAYNEYIQERPNQRREGTLSDSMIRHHLFSLRLFFDYLCDANVISSSPLHLPKFGTVQHKARQILSQEEVQKVYQACNEKRERALISVAYGCGLRRTEIAKLDVGDLILHRGVLIVRDGKGGKSRSVPMSEGVIKELRDYILCERPKLVTVHTNAHSKALFLNNKGKRAGGEFFAIVLSKVLERTNDARIIKKGITLHCLRHSIATHLLDNGATVEFVKEFLGHAEIDTAMIYSKRRKLKMKIQYN